MGSSLDGEEQRAGGCVPFDEKYLYDAYSAQGRFDLARALLEGEIELTPRALEVIYTCTLCGACDVTCKFSRDMEPLEILHELRSLAVKEGKGPLPGHMPAVESIRKNSNPWLQPRTRRAHWARTLGLKDLTKDKAEVLYFAGCTYSYNANLQKVAQATARIMKEAGMDVGILGNGENCCASPALKVGMADLFQEFAGKNIAMFNELGVKTVVTSCAGCYGIFRSQYPAVGRMNFEVVHSVEIMDQLIENGTVKFKKKIPMKVTWHDPCHSGRGGEKQNIWEGERTKWGLSDPPRVRNFGAGGVYDAPRNILKALPGIELVEMERIREFAWCCGAGGGVKSAFPEFALESALERVDEAKATGAAALVTSCPWCESNLADAIVADGSKIKLYSLVELIEQAL
jgi:Fe-S oxidoreductase